MLRVGITGRAFGARAGTSGGAAGGATAACGAGTCGGAGGGETTTGAGRAGSSARGGATATTAGRSGAAASAGRGGGADCSAWRRAISARATSPGFEARDRSNFGLVSPPPAGPRDDERPPVRCLRTFSASSSSMELEWVFFSVTPTAESASRMLLLLTSSSRARSLMRTLLIRPRNSSYPLLAVHGSSTPEGTYPSTSIIARKRDFRAPKGPCNRVEAGGAGCCATRSHANHVCSRPDRWFRC